MLAGALARVGAVAVPVVATTVVAGLVFACGPGSLWRRFGVTAFVAFVFTRVVVFVHDVHDATS